MGVPGENFPPPVPDIKPFSETYPTAWAYQAEELTSVKLMANAVCPKPHNIVKLKRALRTFVYVFSCDFSFPASGIYL